MQTYHKSKDILMSQGDESYGYGLKIKYNFQNHQL